MTNSLTKRTISGVRWTASSALASRFIGFARAIILARLLVPDDFGVYSMAITVVALFEAMTRLGLEQSLTAARYSNSAQLGIHLDTAWSVELIRRLAMAVVLVLVAPYAARFYGVDELRTILPVLGAALVVHAFQNIGLFILRRQLSFKRILWHELLTLTITAGSSVLLALFVTRSVWALLWGELIGTAVSVLTSYAFYPRRPRFVIARHALSRILNFGKHSFVIGIASFVTTTADNVAVGKLLGAAALGAYAVAYNLINMSSIGLVEVFNKVTLPAYAELHAESPERIAPAFARVLAWSAALLAGIAAIFWVCSVEIVHLLYGEKWLAAGAVLQILSALGFVRGLALVLYSLLFGMDKPRLVARGKFIEAALFVTLIYPLVSWLGLRGAAWTGVIVYSFAVVMRLRLLDSVVPGAAPTAWKIVLTATACGFGGVVAGTIAASPFDDLHLRLLAGSSAAGVATALAAWWLIKDLRGDGRKVLPDWLSREVS